MRAALVHDRQRPLQLTEQILGALLGAWPEADVYVADKPVDLGKQAASIAADPFSLAARMRQRRLIRSGSPFAKAYLEGYDFVISTSVTAAQRVSVPAGSPHICYVSPVPTGWSAGAARDLLDPLTALPAAARSEAGLLTELPAPSLGFQGDRFPVRGVTQYIAASIAIRDRISCRANQDCAVVHPPVDTEHYRPARMRREAFYLLAGGVHATRNVQLAAAACRQARRNLIVLGAVSRACARFLRALPHLRLVSAPDRGMLRDHFQRCSACLVPDASDFAATAVEAQACGTPVIAYALGCTPEIVIDAEANGCGTGLLFHEPTAASLVSAMLEFERRPQCCEPALAIGNAARFSRSRFIREMTSLILPHVAAAHPNRESITFPGSLRPLPSRDWFKPAA